MATMPRCGSPASATSTRLPARRHSTACSRQPYQPSAPCIVGYCRARRRSSRACDIHRVDHRAPGIDVFLIAGHEQRVVEARQRPLDAIAILALAGHRVDRTESPAVRAAPPLAVRPADLAVEIDVARDDAAVLLHAIQPGVHVFDDPAPCTWLRRPAGTRWSAASWRPDSGSGRRRRRCIPRSARGTARTVDSPCSASNRLTSNGSPTQSSAVALRSIGPRLPFCMLRMILWTRVVVGRLRILAHVEARRTAARAPGTSRRPASTGPCG